mgnify:CR=1 FL=1
MDVLRCDEIGHENLSALLARYGLDITLVADGADIPGTFWKEPEAGLIGDTLYIRSDTPVHSALHESCHYICMDAGRRAALHTDAGGTAVEENGVCYLQILLSDHIAGMGRHRMLRDMDEWGYSFRLGSARAWFEQDAEDAQAWLMQHGLIENGDRVTFQLRKDECL